MLTLKQLRKFAETRNASGFSSNLQFVIDAQESGFRSSDLGPAVRGDDGSYTWKVQAKDGKDVYDVELTEGWGRLELRIL